MRADLSPEIHPAVFGQVVRSVAASLPVPATPTTRTICSSVPPSLRRPTEAKDATASIAVVFYRQALYVLPSSRIWGIKGAQT